MESPELTQEDLENFSLSELNALLYDWSLWARPSQLPPDHPSSTNHNGNPNYTWDYWVALAGRGYGKALDIRTPILTDSGWKTMGSLTDQDKVYAPDGRLTNIITHDIYHPKECYKLTFSDHTEIIADGEHLWTLVHMRSKGVVTLPTNKISPTDLSGRSKYRIPATLPLSYPSQTLLIDPYLLGVWIGDGTSSQGRITVSNVDLQSLTSQLTDEFHLSPARKDTCSTVVIPSLPARLKKLNLLSNKHIPESYLRSSESDRISLLQGLIDTDGCITKRGYVSFTTIYEHLALQVKELTNSLGLVAQVYEANTNSFGKKCHCYRVKFVPGNFLPSRNPRKLLSHKVRSDISEIRSSGRTIKSIESVDPTPVRCITVQHPSRLYLVTNSFISTHNTRLGAEQVLRWVDQGYRRIHILAPTTADTRDTIVEGESGILNCAHPSKRPIYEPSKRRLTFPNGAIATLFSAEEPERLRGPQCDAAWLDEIAAWQYPQEAWDQLHFGLRLGKHPQVVITTTPKPIPLIKSLIERARKNPESVVLTTGSTYDNKANLAKTFFTQVAQYEGTRLGRQELHAELIDPRESGIVRQPWFNLFPAKLPLPRFEHILQSYDTAFTEKTVDRKTKDPDPSAASTWGVFRIPDTPGFRTRSPLNPNPPPKHVKYGVLLLDAWCDHLGFPELRSKVQKEYNNSVYGPDGDERRADTVLIEDKGSGISLRQDLQRLIPVRAYNPGRSDKLERLHLVSHLPCNGMVYIPESTRAPGKPIQWSDPLIDQVCSYPLVEHDDLMDTFTQALQYLKDSGFLISEAEEEEEEYADTTPTRRNPYAT